MPVIHTVLQLLRKLQPLQTSLILLAYIWVGCQSNNWFNAAMQEVPLLSPCRPPPPPPMLSKNVGGKFKYLNRKNSEFLAGNSNAKCKTQNRPKPTIFAQTQHFRPNPKSPEHKIFT